MAGDFTRMRVKVGDCVMLSFPRPLTCKVALSCYLGGVVGDPSHAVVVLGRVCFFFGMSLLCKGAGYLLVVYGSRCSVGAGPIDFALQVQVDRCILCYYRTYHIYVKFGGCDSGILVNTTILVSWCKSALELSPSARGIYIYMRVPI